MKYVGTYSDPKDIVTKEKLDAVEAAIPTKTSQLDNDSGFITSAPVTSVNAKTGAVTLSASDVGAQPTITVNGIIMGDGAGNLSEQETVAAELVDLPTVPTKVSELTNDANYITAAQAPVQSVNNKTGAVSLTASDVGSIPNVPVTTTNNLDMLMVLQGNWYTDHGASGIQDASSLIVNKWPDNVTVIVRSFRRWGKLCLFTVQMNVTTQISTNYGFTLLEMPYTSIDRVWINNQTRFYMDGNNVAVRVNNDNLATGNYILTGFYLTTDNARAV